MPADFPSPPHARPLRHARQALPGIRFPLVAGGFALLFALLLLALAAVIAGARIGGAAASDRALAVHVATVIPALFIGTLLLALRKGTPLHKALGRLWALLMMATALASFGLHGLTGGIGPIHIFSVITLVSIPLAIWRARAGDIRGHRRAMLGPYIGLLGAGLFAFLPGRLLGDLVAGLF